MTSDVDVAVTAGSFHDVLLGPLLDAVRVAVETHAMSLGVELGRQQALAAVAAAASQLLQEGRSECAAALLTGLTSVRSSGAPVAGDVHCGRPGADDVAGATPAEGGAGWRRVGDLWHITFAGVSVHLAHRKGIADLAALLARPGREIAALDLAATSGPRTSTTDVDGLGSPGDLGARLDADARAAYTARIRQLQDDLDAADGAGDTERSAQAQHELDFLVRELSAAYGLHGARRVGDPAERARSTVTMRVRGTIAKIREAHPELGRHLERSVATGRFCVYTPEKPVTWDVTT